MGASTGTSSLTSTRERPGARESLERYRLGGPVGRNARGQKSELEKQVDEVLDFYELRERRDRGLRAGAIFAVLLTPLVLVAFFVLMVAPR